MDRENANYDKVLADLREAFHQDIVPLIIPVGAQSKFSGVVDLISRKYLKGAKGEEAPLPPEMAAEVERAREKLVEAAAEGEDGLMEKFFAGEELTMDELLRGLRNSIRNRCEIGLVFRTNLLSKINCAGFVDQDESEQHRWPYFWGLRTKSYSMT